MWRALVGLLVLPCASAIAEPVQPDKSFYTFFNPTPTALLRELTTDRPDTTESPFTVDAGHVQLETGVFGFTRSRTDSTGTTTKSYDYGTTNVRVGLSNSVELNLIYQPYGTMHVSSPDPAIAGRFTGIGDLTIRTKFNLWGNDSFKKPGDTSFGLLPFVIVPTDKGNGISSDFTQGGLILPLAIKLTDKLDVGLNGGVQWVHNEETPGYHKEYLMSASFAYEWTQAFSTYYEVAANLSMPSGDVKLFGTGASYKLNKNFQLDAGVNFGATRAAPRVNPFVGVSARF